MIRHVVMLRWGIAPSADELAALSAALDALPAQIPELLSYEHGPDLGLAPTNFDYAITATFASVDDFPAYRDHPAHQAFVADHIAPRRPERAAVQFRLRD